MTIKSKINNLYSETCAKPEGKTISRKAFSEARNKLAEQKKSSSYKVKKLHKANFLELKFKESCKRARTISKSSSRKVVRLHESLFKEAGQVPPGAKSVKGSGDVPKGWSVMTGPKGGKWAVPPAGGKAPKSAEPKDDKAGDKKAEPKQKPDPTKKVEPPKLAPTGDKPKAEPKKADEPKDDKPKSDEPEKVTKDGKGEEISPGDKVFDRHGNLGEITDITDDGKTVTVKQTDNTRNYVKADELALHKKADGTDSKQPNEVGDKQKAVEDQFGSPVSSVQDDHYYTLENGEEYQVYDSDEDAEQAAIDDVREQLEDAPENFDQDWLQQHIDTDSLGEDLARDEYDSSYDNAIYEWAEENPEKKKRMDELDAERSQAFKDVGNASEWSKTPNGKEYQKLTSEEDDYADKEATMQSDMVKEDPLQWWDDATGEPIPKEWMDRYLDIDKASQDAIDTDGRGHFLSPYDGEEVEMDNGMIAYRRN